MKKSILFIAAIIIVSTDFIAQGSVQEQEKTKTTQTKEEKSKMHKKHSADISKNKSSKENKEEIRKMDKYKSNEPAGGSESEQRHMDTTVNNHR